MAFCASVRTSLRRMSVRWAAAQPAAIAATALANTRLWKSGIKTRSTTELLRRLRDRVEVARQPGLGDRPVEHDLGQGAGNDGTHLDQPVEVDPGVAAHRFEQERGVFHDDVAGGARRVGAAAEP